MRAGTARGCDARRGQVVGEGDRRVDPQERSGPDTRPRDPILVRSNLRIIPRYSIGGFAACWKAYGFPPSPYFFDGEAVPRPGKSLGNLSQWLKRTRWADRAPGREQPCGRCRAVREPPLGTSPCAPTCNGKSEAFRTAEAAEPPEKNTTDQKSRGRKKSRWRVTAGHVAT